MKNIAFRAYSAFFLTALLLISCSPQKETAHTITSKEITVYESLDDHYTVNAYFVDDIESPYFRLEDLLEHRMSEPEQIGFPIPDLKLSYKDGILKATNIYKGKDYYLSFDARSNTIKTTNFLKAVDIFEYGLPCDLLGADRSPITINASVALVEDHPELTLDLGKYGIELVSYGDSVLIPLFELNNIYFNVGEKTFVYNGDDLYLSGCFEQFTTLKKETDLGARFYHIDSVGFNEAGGAVINYEKDFVRNKEMNASTASFNKGAILSTFNDFFGRKKEGIYHSAEEYADGLRASEKLGSTKPLEAFEGLGLLCEGIDDIHTNIVTSGALVGSLNAEKDVYEAYQNVKRAGCGSRASAYRTAKSANRNERNSLLGEKAATGFYYEGDTCFIRFDSFAREKNDSVFDLASGKLKNVAHEKNTFHLFYNAFADLTANHKNIKNIVIDESINGGGDATTLVEIAGFFMEEVRVLFRNAVTEQVYEANYKVDTNLDGKIDSDDAPGKNYNVYLLCSESSFSCGNLLPTVFRYNKVGNIIGRTSSGGSCVVFYSSSPIGDQYRISGPLEYGLPDRNGNFLSADNGIHPDYYLENSLAYNQAQLDRYLSELALN